MPRSASKPRFAIEVTEKDIARAKVNDSYNCVVSQAIARAIPDATNISTDIQSIRFTRDGQRHVYLTPYAVQGYVVAFDAGEEIEPFSFQLRNPQLVARKIRTEAGKAVQRAYNEARRKTKPAQLSSPEDEEPRKAAKAAYAEARKVHAGEKLSTMSTGHRAPPKIHKKKTRSYGHRLLRINQD